MSRRECMARRNDAGHLFVCPYCRAEARMASAWNGAALGEVQVAADEKFVARVVESLGRDRAQRSRRRFWLAAAAAALFCFFAGLSHESSEPAATAEEAYATLASPSVLEGLIPN